MSSVVATVPSLKSLKITGYEHSQHLDFSFLEICPNLEVLHFNRVSRWAELSQPNIAQFSHLKKLVEVDLHDSLLYSDTMLTLWQSLPPTLLRFRHLSDVAMTQFSFIAERFPMLEEFYITASKLERPRVSLR